jgi:hypothetical protein
MITAGLVDRAIDQWETEFGRSTIKNTVSALIAILEQLVDHVVEAGKDQS